MLCAGEAAQKEALTRDGYPGLTAGANLFRAYGAVRKSTEELPSSRPSVQNCDIRLLPMIRLILGPCHKTSR